MSDTPGTPSVDTPAIGLLPVNRDGFESGDRERFAPVYIGDSTNWVRPRFEVSDRDPIAGRYSLVLRGDGAEQRWLLVSNAFHLGATFTVSLLFRQQAEGADFALLGAVERYSKGEIPRYAIVDALRLSGGRTSLEIGVDAATWVPSSASSGAGALGADGAAGPARRLTAGRVYRLVMAFLQAGHVEARVLDEETQQVMARFAGVSATRANGIGLYFHSPVGTAGAVQVDDIEVEYDGYELPEGAWARSPQFVAFKRAPDAVEDQGEWVGAASAMYDEEEALYKLWYRIRRGGVRGLGYGYATSRDGLSWQRHPGNPVLTYDKQTYSSTEKITVLKIDGHYEGWYTGDVGPDWHVVRVTSPDGIEWTQHGEVLAGGYFKDPDVVFVDGTYYMYLISPSSEELSVMTSADGTRWEHRADIPAPCHVHIGAYYDAPRRRFVLFQDAVDQVPCMRAATADDGLHFGPFEPVLDNAEVGLDDIGIGVNYPSFYRNGLGHITSPDEVVMLYQARHDYHNNRPGWPWAGDGKLVLAGRFYGARLGVPSLYRPGQGLLYQTFPYNCPAVPGFDLRADAPVAFLVESWDPGSTSALRWQTTSRRARLDLRFAGLVAGGVYRLTGDSGESPSVTADSAGVATCSVPAHGTQVWELGGAS